MTVKKFRNVAFVCMFGAVALVARAGVFASPAVQGFCDECGALANSRCGGEVCWTGSEPGCGGLQYECDEVLQWCYTPCSY